MTKMTSIPSTIKTAAYFAELTDEELIFESNCLRRELQEYSQKRDLAETELVGLREEQRRREQAKDGQPKWLGEEL